MACFSSRLVVLIAACFFFCRKAFCLLHQLPLEPNPLFIGFDLGTSGARISVIARTRSTIDNDNHAVFEEVYTKAVPWLQNNDPKSKGSYDDPDTWMNAVHQLLAAARDTLGAETLARVASMCVSGTSASCCLIDSTTLKVTRQPRMYNYHVITSTATSFPEMEHHPGQKALDLLDRCAPSRHTARSSTGSLAKLLAWHYEQPLAPTEVLCHQSDFVRVQLSCNSRTATTNPNESPTYSFSDWHNCLKLGYDVRQLTWPEWLIEGLKEAGIQHPLSVVPFQVVSPGQPLAQINPDIVATYGLSPKAKLVAGTTDSNAAFMAAALGQKGFGDSSELVGNAVTSLGSTLALKLLSQGYVEDADRGVYSHRFPQVRSRNDNGELWLVGGASNVGCAVLRQEGFDNDELDRLSAEIDSTTNSPLDYYPLATKRGERFPVADSNKEPCLEPVPQLRKDYLHGILQGISNVERDGYRVLGELGAIPPRPTVVLTCGGGSRNDMWSLMRERRLNEAFDGNETSPRIKVRKAENVEASYGAALLAASSF